MASDNSKSQAQKPNNPYSVYMIYDKKKNRTSENFLKSLTSKSRTDDNNIVIFTNLCYEGDDEKDKRYIVCMKKVYNDLVSKDVEFLSQEEIVIKHFKPSQGKLKEGLTYSFFIKTDTITEEEVANTFQHLEDMEFLNKGSYEIISPAPYPDGTKRKYIAIVFSKIEGSTPRAYIRKLKALLNNTIIGENKTLKINWLSASVLRDIRRGHQKNKLEIKTK